jgi:hypothetical protein
MDIPPEVLQPRIHSVKRILHEAIDSTETGSLQHQYRICNRRSALNWQMLQTLTDGQASRSFLLVL